MNLNENAEDLKKEEQNVLDNLITKMDKVIRNLDQRMQNYVEEARNTDISINPDTYLAKLLAQQGLKDTNQNRKKFLQARDELYHTRLLLHYKDVDGEGIDEIKVGLHSCGNNAESFVTSWKMPLCRHYILNNSSVKYESVVKDRHGVEHHTDYTLIVKNQVKLRFTRVVSALNLMPGVFDDVLMNKIKGTGYFSDSFLEKMIQEFTNAIYKGQKWVKDHTAKEIAEAIQSFFPDTDLDLLATAIQSYKDIEAWNETPVLKEESFNKLQDVISEAGELKQKAPYDKIVNNNYAYNACK